MFMYGINQECMVLKLEQTEGKFHSSSICYGKYLVYLIFDVVGSYKNIWIQELPDLL